MCVIEFIQNTLDVSKIYREYISRVLSRCNYLLKITDYSKEEKEIKRSLLTGILCPEMSATSTHLLSDKEEHSFH